MSASEKLKYFIYDLETLVNFFSFSGKFYGNDRMYTFEMSPRRDQRSELLTFLSYLENSKVQMVGFNNLGFDYPIIHHLLNNPYVFTYHSAYLLCQQIINSQNYGAAPFPQITIRDRKIPQIDLVKINHFDNKNKRTPLKSLQFSMRLPSVEDMPVKIGVDLTVDQMDKVLSYNHNDVIATEAFLSRCEHLIDMRKELLDNGILTGDVLNFSDVKIGSEYLIKRIGRAKCFSGNKPVQTHRQSVDFKDIILPKIWYRTEPFKEVLEWFNKQVVYHKAEEKPALEVNLAGIDFKFGLGGVHGSVEDKKYESNSKFVIKDVDVTGMYVAVAIANGFAPEHLGKDFSVAYKQLQLDRAQYKKGTTMNGTLKLAGNGAYGKSNDMYSCFFDPKYTYTVTANGQLQLLQLVEVFSMIPQLEIIQANTDGITVYMPRELDNLFQLWKSDWENQTGLKLEEVEYSKMWISDVNNYVATTVDGKIKSKGKYFFPREQRDYDGIWNKDFSSMCVQKVIEQTLINGWPPEVLIKIVTDPFDFMIRYKTPGGAKVFIGDREMLKTVRYYVSTKGEPMKKVATPKGEIGTYKRKNQLTDKFYNEVLTQIPKGSWDERIHTKNKTKYDQVVTSIESGRLVRECNIASKFDWKDVDFDYYVQEVKKLYIGETNV